MKIQSRARWRAAAVVGFAAVTAVTTAATGLSVASAAAPASTTVDGTVPAWMSRAEPAVSAQSTDDGSSATLPIRVYLQPRGGTKALEARGIAMATPGSPQYGKFITAAQYNASYQPTAADADTVASYLKSKGLTGVSVSADRRFVSATGAVADLNGAFGVTLSRFSHDGQVVLANTTPVKLPTAVASKVLTVSGLDTTTSTMKAMHVDGGSITNAPADGTATQSAAAQTPAAASDSSIYPAGGYNARPCSVQWGALKAQYQADLTTKLPKFQGKFLNYAACGYNGTEMRGAYSPFSKLYGAGATIAIVDAYAAPRAASDAATYAKNNGDAAYTKGQYTQVLPATFTNQELCDAPGWSTEQMLDVEAAHGMAPQAKIRYYAAPSCLNNDFVDTIAKIVQENKVDIVSNSYGGQETFAAVGDIAAVHQVLLQAAVQGISFLYSSGDSGDYSGSDGLFTYPKGVSYPASDNMATAIGGTATGMITGFASPVPVLEAGWGTHIQTLSDDGKSWEDAGFRYGSGGGYSAVFNRPAYQNGVVPSSSPTGRAVPDISANADPSTGLRVGLTQLFPDGVHYGERRIGGTSLAAPLTAGYFATAVGDTHKRLGLLNPAIYNAAKISEDPNTSQIQIVDVTPYAGVGLPEQDKGDVQVSFVNGIDDSDGYNYSVHTFNQDSSLTVTKGWDDVTGAGTPGLLFLRALVGHDPTV